MEIVIKSNYELYHDFKLVPYKMHKNAVNSFDGFEILNLNGNYDREIELLSDIASDKNSASVVTVDGKEYYFSIQGITEEFDNSSLYKYTLMPKR